MARVAVPARGILGAVMYHLTFNFARDWHRLIADGRGAPVRAQMLLIGLVSVAVIPLLSLGSVFGQDLRGSVAPLGVSVVVGAAMFGVGMQLARACGIAPLSAVGGGSVPMLLVLVFFVAGTFVGTLHVPWWIGLPALDPIVLDETVGIAGAVAMTLAGLTAVAGATVLVEKRRHRKAEALVCPPPRNWIAALFLRRPWPLLYGALALAVLAVVVLIATGHTWTVIPGYRVWGAKIAQAFGMPVEAWSFWTWRGPANALNSSILEDIVSILNFGILLGAALAASLAGRFALPAPLKFDQVLVGMAGGLLMGYGAAIAYGCNIGAMFGGIASGSLHGWLWFAAAWLGSYLTIRAMPRLRFPGVRGPA